MPEGIHAGWGFGSIPFRHVKNNNNNNTLTCILICTPPDSWGLGNYLFCMSLKHNLIAKSALSVLPLIFLVRWGGGALRLLESEYKNWLLFHWGESQLIPSQLGKESSSKSLLWWFLCVPIAPPLSPIKTPFSLHYSHVHAFLMTQIGSSSRAETTS